MTAEAPARTGEAGRAARRRAVLQLVETTAIGSQEELAELLRRRGFAVTQATVSRDIADLGLVKALRGDRHAYLTQRAFADDAGSATGGAGGTNGPAVGTTGGAGGTNGPAVGTNGPAAGATEPGRPVAHSGEARLRRVLADYPVRVGRSGLTLVLISSPGSAAAIAQAIDESGFNEQVGTLAGDNTLLVLFADEPALERWRIRLATFLTQVIAGAPADDLTSTYP